MIVKGALQKLAESFNGKSKPKTGQGKENNCIAQEEVEAEGDEAKKKLAQTTIKWHKHTQCSWLQLWRVARCDLCENCAVNLAFCKMF